MDYQPQPIDTSGIELSDDVLDLVEILARHAHDVWARERLSNGWVYGSERSDLRKEHPSLVPYEDLSESEKNVDRVIVLETIKAMTCLGYRLDQRASTA